MQDQGSTVDSAGSFRAIRPALVPALVAFVLTGLLSPLYSSDDFHPGLTLWQAVVLWPIGALLLGFPAGLLAVFVTDKRVFRAGQIVLMVVAVVGMATTALSDDAQAGLAFFIIPWFGSPAVLCLCLVQWFLGRRQK